MNTTATRIDPDGSDRPARPLRAARGRLLAAVAAVAVLGVGACSDEQRRDLGEEDVRVALSSHVEEAVSGQDLDIDGDLDCSADIAADSTLSASCTGTTASGEAISGTFSGTADVDDETCTADLSVEVDGAVVAEESGVECFEDV